MRCTLCGAQCREGEAYCRQCGAPLEKKTVVEVVLTREEALSGCRKSVEFPGMYEPARISLIGGLKDGQELLCRTARFATKAGYAVRPLYLTIRIQKGEKPPLKSDFPSFRPDAAPAPKQKSAKKKPPFWASFAAFLSFLPRTVLLTALLFYFTEKRILELAGTVPVLLLCGLSLILLLLLNASLSGAPGKTRLKCKAVAAALAAALLIRYVPPLAGIDLEKAAARISVISDTLLERYAPGLLPAASPGPGAVPSREEGAPAPAAPGPSPSPVPAADISGVRERAQALIPHFTERGYLRELSDRELSHFLALYKAAAGFESVCLFPESISAKEAELLMQLLRIECPEMFMVDFSSAYLTSGFSGGVAELTVPFAMDRAEYEELYARCLETVRGAITGCESLSQEERELAAYRYLCTHCRYETEGRLAGAACGALLEGRAKCDGISLAMKWMLEEMDIVSVILTGKSESEDVGHAWNAVREDGVYLHTDVTADVGVCADSGFCLYGAFRMPGKVCEGLYPQGGPERERFSLPSAADYSRSFHYRNGSLVPAGTAYGGILDSQALEVKAGERAAVYLQFETEEDYLRFRDRLSSAVPDRLTALGIYGTYSIYSLDACRVCRIELGE